MTETKTVLTKSAKAFDRMFLKTQALCVLKQQNIYQDFNSGVSFSSEDWDALSWHIREVEHLNSINASKNKLKARILRKQARINRFSLATVELSFYCVQSQQNHLKSIVSVPAKRELKGLFEKIEDLHIKGRDLNHFVYSGPQWMKRFRLDQSAINQSLLSALEALSSVLELHTEALSKSGYTVCSEEVWADLVWHLKSNNAALLKHKDKSSLTQRLLSNQWQMNQYNVIIFDKLFELCKQNQEQILKILSK